MSLECPKTAFDLGGSRHIAILRAWTRSLAGATLVAAVGGSVGRRVLIAAGVIAIVAALAAFFFADPRNFVLLDWRGFASSGSRFGVKIGMPMSEGEARLDALAGVNEIEVKRGGLCIAREYAPDRSIVGFADNSWRKGSICLVGKAGRVEEISWDYGFVPAFP